MKKRTNGVVAILWGIGAVAMIVVIIVIRFRIDAIAEFVI